MNSSFADWRRDFRKLGFKPLGTGGRKGTHLGRDVDPFYQSIGVVVADHRGGAFSVQLNINMDLRSAEPAHRVVILDGDLAPAQVRMFEPWVHDPGHTTWWPPDQIMTARDAVEQFGLEWLDRHSDIATLIRYFEQQYERHQGEQEAPKSAIWRRSRRRKVGISSDPPSAHHEYLLWLSMLYELSGALDLARDRLDEYAAAVEARGLIAEAARLERHRNFLARLSDA